ncbi:MAG: (d)CMP kinase [Oligoflexales bacterium]|nr:(d)CMP kinase [Oligoflexales bacterium]
MTEHKKWIIAVDGPAGSGKSTVCKALSHHLGWIYLNTGLLYRALAYAALQVGLDMKNESALTHFTSQFHKSFYWDIAEGKLFYEGEDINSHLNSEVMGQHASFVGKNAKVRELLLPIQRELASSAQGSVILDGRDIGTVVFPQAEWKFFITASLEERASRRREQLLARGGLVPSLEDLMQEISSRDEQDKNRSAAPLLQAKDAITIDSTGKTLDETLAEILAVLSL